MTPPIFAIGEKPTMHFSHVFSKTFRFKSLILEECEHWVNSVHSSFFHFTLASSVMSHLSRKFSQLDVSVSLSFMNLSAEDTLSVI